MGATHHVGSFLATVPAESPHHFVAATRILLEVENVAVNKVPNSLAVAPSADASSNALAGLYTWGSNAEGAALQTDNVGGSVASPTYVGSALTNIQGGKDFACAPVGPSPYLVVCWGSNSNGQSGNSSPLPYSPLPSTVDFSHVSDPGFPTILAVGGQHGCVALSQSRGTMCWGANDLGQLGNGSYTQADLAVAVESSDMGVYVSVLSAGDKHTCAIVVGGLMFCWGSNANGQLGVGSNVSYWNLPAQVISPTEDGEVIWNVVAAGLSNTCGVSTRTAIYCWGKAATGGNGNNNTVEDQFVPASPAIAMSDLSTLTTRGGTFYAMKSSGELYVWGDNSRGQAGLGSAADAVSLPTLLTIKAKAIAAGLDFACLTSVTLAGQQLSCFGDNSLGQLGIGTDTPMSNVPVVVSPGSTGVWATNISASYNTVFAFQTTGDFGGADVVASKIVCKAIKSLTREAEAMAPEKPASAPHVAEPARAPEAVGHSFKDAPSDDASPTGLYTWGSNEAGALLMSSPVGQDVVSPTFTGAGISNVQGGMDYACGLMGSFSFVACWGLNSSGQLGNGMTEIYTSVPVPVNLGGYAITSLGAGARHVCVTVDGSAPQSTFCWGANEAGQLGNGTYSTSATPTWTQENGLPFTGVVAGGAHSCAIRPDGKLLYCWGDNSHGQIGVNIVGGNSAVPKLVIGDSPGLIPGQWHFVAAGTYNTCGTLLASGVYCWGRAAVGANGNNNLVTDMLFPSQMVVAQPNPTGIVGRGNTFFAWNGEGIAFAWGDNSSGQTGLIDYPSVVATATALEITGVQAIAAGDDFGLVLQTDGTIVAFGSNSNGQLGIGSTATVTGPQQVPGQWSNIGAGGSASYAVGVPAT
ncbi:hypothetical protein H632_c105p1 [Helicosporidium sp. ATCC 50920]|nr:hypothetical protein H632_c105p1 [Helicosporidium sp. ATCC 50920]|eukprot:KDD76787.1 hypothetical protein H632_c105p1 [Helicosporidium sp. ATCC 50920]